MLGLIYFLWKNPLAYFSKHKVSSITTLFEEFTSWDNKLGCLALFNISIRVFYLWVSWCIFLCNFHVERLAEDILIVLWQLVN